MSIQLRILAFMPNHKKKNVEISTALEERGEQRGLNINPAMDDTFPNFNKRVTPNYT